MQHHLETFLALAAAEDPLGEGVPRWVEDDFRAYVRCGILAEIRALRAAFVPADITIDALYPEAELLVDLGDLRGAVEWLAPTLAALPQVTPNVLASPERAASLVRAMALRAVLADIMGDSEEASRFARVVTTLWSDADPFLHPLVQQLRRLTR